MRHTMAYAGGLSQGQVKLEYKPVTVQRATSRWNGSTEAMSQAAEQTVWQPVENRRGEKIVILKIRRFDPASATRHRTGRALRGPVSEPSDRVLDALHFVKWNIDGSLTFRRSCGHGVCGSDAMRINGTNKLACKILISERLAEGPGELKISVEPIQGLPVNKDLLVDMEPFFASYRAVQPWLINDEREPERERRAEPKRSGSRYDDTTKCILCARMHHGLPVFWNDGDYFGPAAIVGAHRFIFDSRDKPARRIASRSSTIARASGAAAPPSTARRPARAGSR